MALFFFFLSSLSLSSNHMWTKRKEEVLRIPHVYKKTVAKMTEKDFLKRMLNSWKHEVNTILIPSFYSKHILAMHL